MGHHLFHFIAKIVVQIEATYGVTRYGHDQNLLSPLSLKKSNGLCVVDPWGKTKIVGVLLDFGEPPEIHNHLFRICFYIYVEREWSFDLVDLLSRSFFI